MDHETTERDKEATKHGATTYDTSKDYASQLDNDHGATRRQPYQLSAPGLQRQRPTPNVSACEYASRNTVSRIQYKIKAYKNYKACVERIRSEREKIKINVVTRK